MNGKTDDLIAVQDTGNSTIGNVASSVRGIGREAALTWSTQFAFLAILFAFMQGTLGLESADPCRISFTKYRIFILLEALEVVVILLSEFFSFSDLKNSLKEGMQWLQWLRNCVLFMRLMEMILDLWLSLRLASASRVGWIPFSAAGALNNNGERRKLKVLLELIPLVAS